MKKPLIALLGGALLLAAVTGAQAEQVTLRLTHAFPSRDGVFLKAIAERFMQQNPDIKIELEGNATDCPALLQQLLRDGVTGNLPDIASGVCYTDMPMLADRGIINPLDKIIAGDASWKEVGIEPGALGTTTVKGHVVAIPQSVSASIAYYNMTAVRKIRPDLKNLDLSWTDVLSIAKDLKAASPEIMPVFFEYYADSYNWSFNSLLMSHGTDVFTEDGKIGFNSKAGRDALGLLQQFGQAGMVDMTAEQARQAFASGKIGIYFASNSRLKTLTANAGPLLDIQTGVFPQSSNTGTLASGGGGMAITAKDTKKIEAAWKFLKFASSAESQTRIVKATGFTPVNTIAVKEPAYLGDYYKANPNALAAIRELPRIKIQNLYPGDNAPRITTAIRDHLQAVITLKQTPEEAMLKMLSDVEKLLPKS
ncbi:extracellular solute-binding protein [Rhizobium miluonense]|uniref:Multiple sugar transport system substrate-binding protein n=1 Tax=Rhizobium miluonense TaxID=411945 RepID=A0A1C3WZQ5_9HYPH|nr:extracellular solute-binding protein [Rhizobium miluonense]SCB45469.1 multiple sugar transport system substrate-binding protein [Rhizobium miluonense]